MPKLITNEQYSMQYSVVSKEPTCMQRERAWLKFSISWVFCQNIVAPDVLSLAKGVNCKGLFTLGVAFALHFASPLKEHR